MAGDTNYSSVSLLLHMNGANNSTTFTDTSPTPKTVTPTGDAKISTSQSKFGGASAVFDGSGDFLSLASDAAFDFGTSDFTIELWVRFTSLAAGSFFSRYQTGSSARGCLFYYTGSAIRHLGGNDVFQDISWTPTTGVWYHVAWSRVSGVTRIFVDGTQIGSNYTDTRNLTPSIAVGVQIARTHTTTDGLNVHIDDMRVTKGVGRYSANFTAPAAAFPDWAGQVLGTVLDASGVGAARTVRAYRRNTGALIASTTSDGSGAYTIGCPTLDEVQVVCLDDDAGTLENDLIHRAIPV